MEYDDTMGVKNHDRSTYYYCNLPISDCPLPYFFLVSCGYDVTPVEFLSE